tara:strand:+ start:2324 stop:2635 length:312 start_codon:yes stop_codon:yes gene_type:complete
MTSIHPLVFIIIGTVVSITSYFMTSDQYNYAPFLYIGIIMAVYGLIKWFVTGFREKSRHHKETNTKPKHKHHLARNKAIYCYNCKVHMPINYKFCPFCGKRVD